MNTNFFDSGTLLFKDSVDRPASDSSQNNSQAAQSSHESADDQEMEAMMIAAADP